MAMRHSIAAPQSLPSARGRHTNRSASFGDTSMSALQFDLPFRVRKSKLDTLSGQDVVKYSSLATHNIYSRWKDAFVTTPGFQDNTGVISLHEKLHRYDLNRVGCVGKEGFVQALKLCQVPLSVEDMSQLFNDLDIRALNKVDIEMFCALVDHWISCSRNKMLSGANAESSESSLLMEDDLLEALQQLYQRRVDFIRCCLQLGGEEYSTNARMRGVTMSLLQSAEFQRSSIQCGTLPFSDIWVALKHVGVNNGLEMEIKQFALKHGAVVSFRDKLQDEILVEPLSLVRATCSFLSSTDMVETGNTMCRETAPDIRLMSKQQLYLCAEAWNKATKTNNSAHFKQQLLARSDMAEILGTGGLRLTPTEVHELWDLLCYRAKVYKEKNKDEKSKDGNGRHDVSSRQDFNEVMSTASVMKYAIIDDIFNQALGESNRKECKPTNVWRHRSDSRLDADYERLKRLGSQHSNAETHFQHVSAPQQQHPLPLPPQQSRQDQRTRHGLSSQDFNSQKAFHRTSTSIPFQEPPFATGSSYGESPPLTPCEEPWGIRQRAQRHLAAEESEAPAPYPPPISTFESRNSYEQPQVNMREISYQAHTPRHVEDQRIPMHQPPSQTKPPAGFRSDDSGIRIQRSDPTRANSLGGVPSSFRPIFPIRHGTGEYMDEHTGDVGNAPAIVHRLRDITRHHRNKLDLIFPEVLNSEHQISRGDVSQGLRKIGIILRDTDTENLFYYANSQYPNECNSGDLQSVVLRLVLGLEVSESGMRSLAQYQSKNRAVKVNEKEEERRMNQKNSLMGAMYTNDRTLVHSSMGGLHEAREWSEVPSGDTILLSSHQKKCLLKVATRANRVIRVCEEVDEDGEGIVYWDVIEKALGAGGIHLDEEGLAAMRGAVINEHGVVSYPSLIFNLQEAAERGKVPRRVGATPMPRYEPPAPLADDHFDDHVFQHGQGNHNLHVYGPSRGSYESVEKDQLESQQSVDSHLGFNRSSYDGVDSNVDNSQRLSKEHITPRSREDNKNTEHGQAFENEPQTEETYEKMKVLSKAKGGIVLGFDFQDNGKATKIRESLARKRREDQQVIDHSTQTRSSGEGSVASQEMAGRSSHYEDIKKQQPPRTRRSNTNMSSKDFFLGSTDLEGNEAPRPETTSNVRLSNNNVLSKDFVVCMDMEGRGEAFKSFHMTEKESEPTIENYRKHPRTRTSNTTNSSQDFLLANARDDDGYNKYETDAMQIHRPRTAPVAHNSSSSTQLGRLSKEFPTKSVNFSNQDNYQEYDRYDGGELRQSSEFQYPSSGARHDLPPEGNSSRGQTKLEQVAAAVEKASKVVTSSVQTSETKWWIKRREAALYTLLHQQSLVRKLFDEEVANKNKYHREISPNGGDCIDVEGLTIVLSSAALGLDLQLNGGSIKWTRQLANELLEHRGNVDWDTFLSIVQWELENFSQYEQRLHQKNIQNQKNTLRSEREDDQVSLPLRKLVREKFRGTALDMNGDGRRATGDIRSLTALLRHAFKRTSMDARGDISVRAQDLVRVFAEFSVYLDDGEMNHMFEGLRDHNG